MRLMRKALVLVLALAVAAIMPLAAFAGTSKAEARKQAPVRAQSLNNAIEGQSQNSSLNREIVDKMDSNGWIRIYGNNRYNTSVTIAYFIMDNFLDGGTFANAVLASGENYPDALGAGALAYDQEAPILLTNKSYVKSAANVICDTLMADDGRAFVFGGTGAIPGTFETAFKSEKSPGQSMVRFAGTSRYDTNLKGLRYYGENSPYVDPFGQLLICSGKGYADSLSASATSWPIMLVGDSLTADQIKFLKEHKSDIEEVDFIGGTGAVSTKIQKQVESILTNSASHRVAGKTRYETSYEIAKYFFNYNIDSVVLAYAKNYPDGLSGAPLCFALDAPLILCDSSNMTYVKKFCAEKGIEYAVALGGSALISDSALNSLNLRG